MPAAPPPVPDHRPLQLAFLCHVRGAAPSSAGTWPSKHLYEIGEALHAHDGVNTFNVIDRTAAGHSDSRELPRNAGPPPRVPPQ
eukprot:5543547-Prymnesium_polylepis.1